MFHQIKGNGDPVKPHMRAFVTWRQKVLTEV